MFRAFSNPLRSRVLRATIAVSIYLSAFVALASAQWNEGVLYSFQGGTDGEWPLGRIVLDSSGNLYGATQAGGSVECWSGWCGVVYQLTPPGQPGGAWTESVLHVFLGYPADGNWPQGGLVTDSLGNLYGSTAYGGTGNCEVLGTIAGCGTVYELSPPAQKGAPWTETLLYNFQGGNDGFVPYGDLAFGTAGNLYGATLYGGGRGKNCGDAFYQFCGTIYELSPPKQKGAAWTEKVLYSFGGIPSGALVGDGANPNGGLALDSAGNIYGTTEIGGFNCPHSEDYGCGSAFMLADPSTFDQPWTETVIHRFGSGEDGGEPNGNLMWGDHGNLYGTTIGGGGGSFPAGTVFQLTPRDGKWTEQVLYTFSDGASGGWPKSSVALDSNGDLYGTATLGGPGRYGTLYRMQPVGINTWAIETLYGFSGSPDGAEPATGLILSGEGSVFGTTLSGGTASDCGVSGCGTVFEVRP